MLGAVIGDVVGSRFEFRGFKSKDFAFFDPRCRLTDDSNMTLAVAKAIMESKEDKSDLGEKVVFWMQTVGRRYPFCGFGGRFREWLASDDPKPYHSFGNGAGMRVSPCGYAAKTLEEAKMMAKKVTEVSHDHPEGLKGGEAIATAVFLAKSGKTISEIRSYVDSHYYRMDFTLDSIRGNYSFDVSCQGSVPQAIECFLESADFEDAIRNAVSLGGDSDTIGAMAGAIAGAYYGIPDKIGKQVLTFMDEYQIAILEEFSKFVH